MCFVDHANATAPTRQKDLDHHTEHTNHTDHPDIFSICPEKSKSSSRNKICRRSVDDLSILMCTTRYIFRFFSNTENGQWRFRSHVCISRKTRHRIFPCVTLPPNASQAEPRNPYLVVSPLPSLTSSPAPSRGTASIPTRKPAPLKPLPPHTTI